MAILDVYLVYMMWHFNNTPHFYEMQYAVIHVIIAFPENIRHKRTHLFLKHILSESEIEKCHIYFHVWPLQEKGSTDCINVLDMC